MLITLVSGNGITCPCNLFVVVVVVVIFSISLQNDRFNVDFQNVPASCVSQSFHHCDKTPEKSASKEERVYYDSQFLQSESMVSLSHPWRPVAKQQAS